MPREQINYPTPREAVEGGPDSPQGQPIMKTEAAVHVSWVRGAHVQVALEADPSYLRFCAEHPNEPSGRTGVWSPVLSPDELDHLIHTLKRARKAAYRTRRDERWRLASAGPASLVV